MANRAAQTIAHGQKRGGCKSVIVAGSSCDIGDLRYSSRMIRFLPILAIATIVGCARPQPFHAYDSPAIKTGYLTVQRDVAGRRMAVVEWKELQR